MNRHQDQKHVCVFHAGYRAESWQKYQVESPQCCSFQARFLSLTTEAEIFVTSGRGLEPPSLNPWTLGPALQTTAGVQPWTSLRLWGTRTRTSGWWSTFGEEPAGSEVRGTVCETQGGFWGVGTSDQHEPQILRVVLHTDTEMMIAMNGKSREEMSAWMAAVKDDRRQVDGGRWLAQEPEGEEKTTWDDVSSEKYKWSLRRLSHVCINSCFILKDQMKRVQNDKHDQRRWLRLLACSRQLCQTRCHSAAHPAWIELAGCEHSHRCASCTHWGLSSISSPAQTSFLENTFKYCRSCAPIMHQRIKLDCSRCHNMRKHDRWLQGKTRLLLIWWRLVLRAAQTSHLTPTGSSHPPVFSPCKDDAK